MEHSICAPSVFLREMTAKLGDASEGWKLVNTGLGRYWSGQFPVMRGYNLYTEMARMADAAARPHLLMASWREAAALIDSGEDILVRAMAHQYVAGAATAAHQAAVAQQQYAEAARLFAEAPRTEASRGTVWRTRIGRLNWKHTKASSTMLSRASPQYRTKFFDFPTTISCRFFIPHWAKCSACCCTPQG